MKRRLFNLCRIVSLALLLATLAIWARSYRALDSMTFTGRFGDPDAPGHGYSSLSLSWMLGTVSVSGGTILDRLPPDDRIFSSGSTSAGLLLRRESPWLQFRSTYSSRPEKPPGWSRGTVARHWRVTVPCWAPALVASVLPAMWLSPRLADRRGARRAARGQCPRCGYDVRTPTDRCPECGTPTPTPATATGPPAPASV